MLMRLVAVLILLLLAGRLVWVQVVMAEEIAQRVEAMRLESRPLNPTRGAILDRAGRFLAVSVPSYAVVADPFQMEASDLPGIAADLAARFALDEASLLARLQANRDSRYLPLHSGVSLAQKEELEQARLPGIELVLQWSRTYPQGETLNQVIGYVNSEGQGEYGLEGYYEKVLAGTPGYVLAEFTHGRTPIENLIKRQVAAVPGHDLVLTIDAPLQELVETKLEAVLKERDARRGLVMAMDAHTGEILVMAMSPGAHPGDRSTWGDPVDFGRITNWAIREHMPMGSIFKIITVAAALEERAVTLESRFIDRGRLVVDGKVISNWDSFVPIAPVPMTVTELMQKSSNVGLIEVGRQVSHAAFVRYLQGFGFLDLTGIDLVGEGAPYLGDPWEQKRDVDWANMYIGQHIELTPIQMLTAAAAIANGGNLVQPHLVREVRDPDGRVVQARRAVQRRTVISAATAREVREMMISVVANGTGAAAQPRGYTAGGKTGTAEKYANGQIKERFLADFIGFAPAANPHIVMLVMIDEPEGKGYGGIVAAPVFADLMPHVMQAVGIAPESAAALGAEQAPPRVVSGVVPEVRWLTVARAKDRLLEAGFKVKTSGTGELVAEQSLAPGSTAKPGETVELKLLARDPAGESLRVPDFRGLSLAEANQLADEIGLTLKPSGAGFVVEQMTPPGTAVPVRSPLLVRLAPRP